jgi:hypothetical protein
MIVYDGREISYDTTYRSKYMEQNLSSDWVKQLFNKYFQGDLTFDSGYFTSIKSI